MGLLGNEKDESTKRGKVFVCFLDSGQDLAHGTACGTSGNSPGTMAARGGGRSRSLLMTISLVMRVGRG